MTSLPLDTGAPQQQQQQQQQQQPIQGTNPFVCNVCQKTYGRIDHLARHFRSHTNEKPFRCHECSKTFARADLLKRHATLHSSIELSGKKRKIRASQACTQCATIKVKCDQEKPCKRCKTKGLECRVDSGSGNTSLRAEDQASPTSSYGAHTSPYTTDARHGSHCMPTPPRSHDASLLQRPTAPGAGRPEPTLEDPSLSDFLHSVLRPGQQPTLPTSNRAEATWNGNFVPRDLMDFSQDLSIDFNDLDAVLAGNWDGWLDPALQPVADKHTDRSTSDTSTPSIENSINLGSQAYSRSAWKWVPTHERGDQDTTLATVLGDGHRAQSTPRHRQQPMTVPLDLQDRDRIIALLLAGCDKLNFQRIVAMFPDTKVLDVFLNDFLSMMEHSIDSWIHIPTFGSKQIIPELLTLMIAGGAVLSTSSHGQRFGYALQEKGRLALPDMFERDNSMTRSLQALQAHAICLDLGTWSGNKRNMELAESNTMPLVTMIRRSGGFRRSRGTAAGPGRDDTPAALDHKWRKWIEAESFKRLAYHVFLYTVQVSSAFQTPPLLSYAEITLELPAPQAVWRAKSALEWREQYFAYGLGQPLPTFVEGMSGPQTMDHARSRIDLELSMYLVLMSHWCLAWEYTQLSSANKAQANANIHWAGTMLASSKCQELRRLLDSFYVAIEGWNVFVPKEVHMVSQLLRMNLCVAFEDLQLLAGKEGEEEARRVFPSLKQWYRSPECREAMWHAGQVLRAARRPAGRSPHASQSPTPDVPWLRDFNAVALYHAGLAFWAYGLLARACYLEQDYMHTQQPQQAGAYVPVLDYEGEPVRLDGDDEELGAVERHRFIAQNKGRAVMSVTSPWSAEAQARIPGHGATPSSIIGVVAARGPAQEPVHGSVKTVPLDDTKLVMEVVVHALTPSSQPPGSSKNTSTPQAGPQRPALVENLVQLMRELGDAAAAVL